MYRKILLAYVGPTFSGMALRQTTGLAQAFGSQIHLLCIATTATDIELAKSGGTTETLDQQKKRKLIAARNQAQRLRDQGLIVTESTCEGDPAIEVGLAAHRLPADLLVMGSSDKATVARWLKSEAGAKMLAHLPCSMLLP